MASRTLEINVVGDPSSASRMFRKVGDDADRAGRRITGFASVSSKGISRVGLAMGGMAVAGAGAAALLGKSFITTASDINESVTKNQVLFGQYSQDIVRFSENSARSFGISKKAALEYTGVFGNLFRSMGTSREESARFSTNLTKLAADMASFNNTSIEDALEAIRSGLVGESEPLRRFGVNLNDAALRQQALKMGLITTTKDALEPQTKALAVMALTTKQTSAAHGDFARTSGGLANQMRVLKARLSDAGAELGERLLPFALKAARALNRMIDQAERGRGPLAAMQRAFKTVSNAIEDATGAMSKFGKENRQELSSVQRAHIRIKDAFISVRRALDPVFGVLGDNAMAMWRAIQRAFGSVIRLLQGDFKGALKEALQSARQYFGGLGRYMGQFLTLLKRGRDQFVKAGQQLGKWIVEGIGEGIKSAAKGGSGFLKDAASGILGPAGPLARQLTGDGIGIGKELASALPQGGAFGGSLMGARPGMAPFAAVGARFGLQVTSGLRPNAQTSSGNQSWHSTGEALDIGGSASGMLAAFRFLKKNYGSRLAELIHTPGGAGISHGASHVFTGQVAADHYDHVHVAYDLGRPGQGDGIGRRARTGDGVGTKAGNARTVVSVGKSVGASQKQILAALATILVESGGLNLDHGDADSLGAFQQRPSQGWGPAGSVAADARQFFAAAKKMDGKGLSAGDLAANVQRPAAQYRGRYAQRMKEASALLAAASGGALGAGGGARGSAGVRMGAAKRGASGTPVAGYAPGSSVGGFTLGGGLGYEGDLARTGVKRAKAEARDDLSGLISSMGEERSIKRRRLRRIRKLLKGRLGKKARIRYTLEEAQLISEIGDLTESIKEYKADRAGGAQTISRADELDAGVDSSAGDAGGGAGESGAAAGPDPMIAELAELVRQQVENQKLILRLAQQGPAILASVVAAVNGDIGGKVGLGYSAPGYAGAVAQY